MEGEKLLKDLPADLMPGVKELPGELKKIAEVIGVANTIKLAQEFRGCKIYIHNIDYLLRKIRDLQIRKAAEEGNTVANLARKFKLSTRQVAIVLKGRVGGDNSKGEAR